MTDALEAIEPSTSTVSYRNQQLLIKPLEVGAAVKIVRLARPVINSALSLEALPEEGSADLIDLAMDMIERHGDDLFAAVALAAGLEVEVERDGTKRKEPDTAFIAGGDLGDFADLCAKLVEVNSDFFDRRLVPAWQAAKAAWVQRRGAGPTPSSSSSTAATH